MHAVNSCVVEFTCRKDKKEQQGSGSFLRALKQRHLFRTIRGIYRNFII
jgi:hypothetical protein